MRGVGAEPRPPRLGPSSEAKVWCPWPPRLTVASLRKGVTRLTSASNTISRVRIDGSRPSGTVVMCSPFPVATSQAAQGLDRLGRLRTSRVVGIGVDSADDADPVDDEARRDRQSPGPVAVTGREVDAELGVD